MPVVLEEELTVFVDLIEELLGLVDLVIEELTVLVN